VRLSYDVGIPAYRTRVLYVPQRPSLLPSNPHSFFETVMSFASRGGGKAKLQSECDPIGLSASWGIDEEMWSRDWSTLSGGESQRVALAIAVALPGTEVLLLDGTPVVLGIPYGVGLTRHT
jgi:ABC-type Mn2+/Zn2+ transport system ATPase subunit